MSESIVTKEKANIMSSPKPPHKYQNFIERYLNLMQAWEQIALAGKEGPLDEKTQRLIKLAVVIGALKII